MRILMLGNSFIFVNELDVLLSQLTGAEVIAHTRGGARLAEQLNPETKMGAKTLKALKEEKWDYVILQEMSNGPITEKDAFLRNAGKLCDKIRENGAKPVFYATWAYKKGSEKMASMNMSYEDMYEQMYDSYHQAAQENDALIADVGKAFYEHSQMQELYSSDCYHPSLAGSKLAARIIAQTIENDWRN
ncbi:MAG: SGNH/GDSL hydrolase family protein [Eubacterium sp.]|nr:SGNH/GDSL hydrolase family protein [Eubacterium sp.]